MHIRWSEESKVGYMTEPKLGDPIDDVWNQPEYNWLGDEYSAHVNSVFGNCMAGLTIELMIG